MNRYQIRFRLILLVASFIIIIFACENSVDVFSSSDIELVQLTFLFCDRDQDWSPDGKKIVFVRTGIEDDIWKLDVDSRKVTAMQLYGINPTWHPSNNNCIVFQQNGNIIKKDYNYQQLLTNSSYSDRCPDWSLDGNKIIFTRSIDVETIWIMNSDGSDQTQLTTNSDTHCYSPSFSSDGTQIVYIKSPEKESEINEIWVMNSNGSDKHFLFAPGDTKQTISKRAWNQDNKIIFTRSYPKGVKSSTASDLWVINADGSGLTPILENFAYSYNNPVWNKQGNKIALTMSSFVKDKQPNGANIYFFNYE